MKIAVVGTGYVGLVTGTLLAETGNKVMAVDINEDKIALLQKGISPIYEPGLENYLHRNLAEGRLKFTADLVAAVTEATLIFLALPTPPNEDGSADLSYVLQVATQIAQIAKDYKVVITKSTVPVGTADKVKAIFQQSACSHIDVVSNPEFLKEGNAVEDFMKPDRIVVGTISEKAKALMAELYAPYVRQGNPILFMDERSAELTKYAANAFLATKISFMNEIANLCEVVGADVDLVRKGIGSDPRIGNRFLFPGIGYGGSCFPKDVSALANIAKQHQYEFKILNSVVQVNDLQKKILVQKIKQYYKNNLKNKRFAIWGLAFKPGTDDIREAPALSIIQELLALGAILTVFDPEAMNHVKQLFPHQIQFANNPYDALEQADALIIATEWSIFRTPDFEELNQRLKSKLIFDGRNLYDTDKMKSLGYQYVSIGRE